MRADPDTYEVFTRFLHNLDRYQQEVAELKKQLGEHFLTMDEQRLEIEELLTDVEIWKDRCAAAEQALEATTKHYERIIRNGE